MTHFLYNGTYPPPFPDRTVGNKWQALKSAYYAMPEAVRMTLPEMPWPAFASDTALQRARNVILLYRHATPQERKPLLEGLLCEPQPDSVLFPPDDPVRELREQFALDQLPEDEPAEDEPEPEHDPRQEVIPGTIPKARPKASASAKPGKAPKGKRARK